MLLSCEIRRSLVAASLLLAAAAAQAPEVAREPTFVHVVDERQRPLPAAKVTFVGNRPELPDAASDRVEAVTDARGRAVARLRTDLCYAAWAVGAGRQVGAASLSKVEGFFAAGAHVELRCDEPCDEARVRIEGLPAWQEHAPFRLRALAWNPAADQELVATGDGDHWVVPPGPWTVRRGGFGPNVLALTGRDGQTLHVWLGGGSDLTLPPPQPIDLRAEDETGKPLANVPMRHRVAQIAAWRLDGHPGSHRTIWRDLGATDADGALRAIVPYPSPPLTKPSNTELLLVAEAPGRAQVVGGVRSGAVYENDVRVAKFESRPLRFELRSVAPLTGELADVPPGTPVGITVVAKLKMGDNGYMHDPRTFVSQVGAGGRFRFDGVPLDVQSTRLVVAGSAGPAWPVFGAVLGRALPLPEAADAAGGWSTLRIEVRDASGGPARGAVVQLAPDERSGTLVRYSIARVPLDTTGAATVRVPVGVWVVLATSAHGSALHTAELGRGSATALLQIAPMPRMSLRLLDAAGEPIEGAALRMIRSTSRGTSGAAQSMLQGLESALRTRLLQQRTDAAGRIDLTFVTVEGSTLQLQLQAEKGACEPFLLEATDDRVDVRVK